MDGIPRIFGTWPTMIVSATPKMKPVMTDLERKSEMNPSRAIPPARSTSPTRSASAAVSARKSAASPAAMSVTIVAEVIAIVELTVTFTWRLDPNTAYPASAAKAVARPSSGGTPARPAYARATGTMTPHDVTPAMRSNRRSPRW